MFKPIFTAALAGILLSSTTAMALDPAPKCESSKLGTSAKYAQCRLKAEAKALKKATMADYSKCNLEKFVKAEDSAGMGVCPTEGDQTTVKDYLDDCTSRAALWLAGGGGLPDTCDSDLVACEGDLSTTNTDLATCEGDLAACEANSGLPRTGQTTAYGAGSDGDLGRGVARSFTDNGDGTITDNVTGLMWEKKSDDGSIHDKDNFYRWTTGSNNMDGTMVTTFLATLNGGGGFAGHTDWRIPNIQELQSLVNFQVPAPGPTVFPEFSNGCIGGCTVTSCSCTRPHYHWSSTTFQADTSTAWDVYFNNGITSGDYKSGSAYVRAVRAGS